MKKVLTVSFISFLIFFIAVFVAPQIAYGLNCQNDDDCPSGQVCGGWIGTGMSRTRICIDETTPGTTEEESQAEDSSSCVPLGGVCGGSHGQCCPEYYCYHSGGTTGYSTCHLNPPPNQPPEGTLPTEGQNCSPTIGCASGFSCTQLGTGYYCVSSSAPQGSGQSLLGGECGGDALSTAIGCIPISDRNALIGFILRWAIGIGGGIAFLLIVVAGFQIMTSTGDPKRLQAGQELLTSAIAGLILLVFSVFILRIIGVDILGIGILQQQ